MAEIKVVIDLNFQFKGPDGYPIKSNGVELMPASKLVGNFLYNGFSPDKSDKARNRAWSTQLYLNGILEVTKKEIDAILKACENGGMSDGVYCELQDYMDSKKEEWDKLRDESKKNNTDA